MDDETKQILREIRDLLQQNARRAEESQRQIEEHQLKADAALDRMQQDAAAGVTKSSVFQVVVWTIVAAGAIAILYALR